MLSYPLPLLILKRKSFLDYFSLSIDEKLVFGSRAMGNEKTGSDIDLALVGEDIQYEDVLNISSLLNEEAPIPYYVDVVQYDSLSNKDLKDQIINEGQALLKYEHLRSFK
ncbi:nucleotidyltransferase domain-containing protein [Marinilactibacillus psychrotolerans]|uniref:nucleotidyltransferase domain-containing protein n=1 Tax=Marinilactibacillus psychrotolerans TaxID=191770 RepID=UPI001866ADCF